MWLRESYQDYIREGVENKVGGDVRVKREVEERCVQRIELRKNSS